MTEAGLNMQKQKEDNLAVGAKGGVIAFILQVTTTGMGFLNQIVLARILGAGGMGEVLLTLSIVNISALIASFGMQGTMMRFVPSFIANKEEAKLKGTIYFVLKFCFFLSVVLGFFILLLSKFIAINIFHSQGLLKLLPVAAMVIPVYVFNEVIGGILKGYKDTFKALLPHSIVAPFFKIIIFLLLSIKGISPLYAITAFLSGELFAVIFSLVFLSRKLMGISPAYEPGGHKRVFDVASTLIFTNISVFLFTQADLWIVGMFTSTESVGIYGAVSRLVLLISFSLSAFSTIIPPIISIVHAAGDRRELQKVVSESTRWGLSLSIPIILILMLEGKFILNHLYGEKFAEGYIALAILSLGQLVNVASGLVGWLLQMTGGHRVFMTITVIGGILNIILNLILVPYIGIIGAAVSTASSIALVNLVSVFVIYKRLTIITFAKGLKFDFAFAAAVTAFYLLIRYKNFHSGYHLLLIIALAVYMWRSVVNGDLPLKYLFAKHKRA